MQRTIIDITYLAHWQGKLTGIPRVINELASRYSKSESNCIFVIWDNEYNDLFEVDILKTLVNRGRSLHYIPAARVQNSGMSSRTIVLTGRAMRKAKSKYNLPVPTALIVRALRDRKNLHKLLEVISGDTYVIMMGEWHTQEYIDKIISYSKQGISLVQFCYDVLPLVQPQYSGHSTLSMDNYNSQVMPLCTKVLCISQHTARDLSDWLKSKKLPVPPLGVFRLGDDFEKKKTVKPGDQKFLQAFPNNCKYILCVGTIEARKNHMLLYYGYKLAAQRNITLPKLVIVGRRGWKTDDFYEFATKDPIIENSFIFLESATDEELSWLYEKAILSVYPSFYEGWGLPIAESIMHGLPCISSNTSSMPEIAGSIINYFEPASTDEFLSSLQHLLIPSNLKAAKKKLKQYTPTTWDQTFKQVKNLIEEPHEELH